MSAYYRSIELADGSEWACNREGEGVFSKTRDGSWRQHTGTGQAGPFASPAALSRHIHASYREASGAPLARMRASHGWPSLGRSGGTRASSVRGWIHFGDARRGPMQTVRFTGSAAALEKALRDARRDGTPAKFLAETGDEVALVERALREAKSFAGLTSEEERALRPWIVKIVSGEYEKKSDAVDAIRSDGPFHHLTDHKPWVEGRRSTMGSRPRQGTALAVSFLLNNWLSVRPPCRERASRAGFVAVRAAHRGAGRAAGAASGRMLGGRGSRVYIIYVDGDEVGMIRSTGHNAAEKKAQALFPGRFVSVAYTEI